MTIKARKQRERKAYLEALYQLVEGSLIKTAAHSEIRKKAGLDSACAKDAFFYLLQAQCLNSHSLAAISLTYQGIKLVETGFNSPLVVINNYQVSECTLQPGLGDFLIALRAELPRLDLANGDKEQAAQEIQTIENELQRKEPENKIIHYALEALKRILKNSALDLGIHFLLNHFIRCTKPFKGK